MSQSPQRAHTPPLRPSSRRKDHRATTPSPLRHSSTVTTTPPDNRRPPPWPEPTFPTPTRRVSLGPLSQAPNTMPSLIPTLKPAIEEIEKRNSMSFGLSRSTSRRASAYEPAAPVLESADLAKLSRSATGHLQTLSKLADQSSDRDLSISSLQRNMTEQVKKTSSIPGYGGRTKMDTERKYRQAYEYLCHIGEAKQWIEQVLDRAIAPIIELEESLRDGVTLAEVVQAVRPEKRLRIFRNPRLQYRHTDNIVIFFDFLAYVEVPEVFHFELVDLYEKKNIPKVILCIHVLSWILAERGMIAFRIGNLVGQLQFENHELESTQKGLDKAGVNMPNFSSVGERFGATPEPPPEPVEREEERIDRELLENAASIARFQSEARGALLRIRLADNFQDLSQEERLLADLQARVRGIMSRETFDYKRQMRRFAVQLQSTTKGFLIRSRTQEELSYLRNHERQVILIQSLVRARAATNQFHALKLEREHYWNSRVAEVILLQSLTRRRAAAKQLEQLKSARRAYWTKHEQNVVTVQKLIRMRAAKKLAEGLKIERAAYWAQRTPEVVKIQSLVRRKTAMKADQSLKSKLAASEPAFVAFQTCTRGALRRLRVTEQLEALEAARYVITHVQSESRAMLQRKKMEAQRSAITAHVAALTDLQSQMRAVLLRNRIADILGDLENHLPSIIFCESLARGNRVRVKFLEKQRFFNENMKKVVKLQSYVRRKQQGEAYRSLTSDKNPPINTIKNFVHLLNDSDFDFSQELDLEKLQQELVQKIQDIEKYEDFISEIDAKIGLLAHTKIASDEIAKIKRQVNTTSVSLMRKNTTKEGFNSAALNKVSRAKLDRYQELFFILQTQPQYLSRLFKRLRERGATEAEYRKLESLVIGAFAFAQKDREQCYLLKLFGRSIKEEVEGCSGISDFARGNFFFTRLFATYLRAPEHRRYMQLTLGSFVRTQILENDQLNLESDPLQIYRTLLNDEELRTGRRSQRDPSLSRELAIREEDVRRLFINHLQDMRDLVDNFLPLLKDNVNRMPFGLRYVVQQMYEALLSKFSPRVKPKQLLQVAGNWLWKVYFKPALTDPEGFNLVEKGLDVMQKRNIAEFSKVVGQIATGRLFDDENVYLQPLNRYLEQDVMGAMDSIWTEVTSVEDAESKYNVGLHDDFYAKNKPTLYIKVADLLSMHNLLAELLPTICLSHEDTILHEILRDLGSVKSNEAAMSDGPAEVRLELGGKIHAIEDPDAKVKALLIETKRCILYIIRVQTGSNLLEILVKPITEDDCNKWDALVHEELSQNATHTHKRNAYSLETSNTAATNLTDIASLTFAELKSTALENIIALENVKRITRSNAYQDLLNSIAIDIRTKHRRRLQRSSELAKLQQTLSALSQKQLYLSEKLTAYNDTFAQSLLTLSEKSAKHNHSKLLLPFSKQWSHERELAKSGRAPPKYGSFKNSAEHFFARGILLSWEGCRDARADCLTFSSERVNEFVVEGSRGSIGIAGAWGVFSWEDLLTAEYEERDVLEFFGYGEDGRGVSGGREKVGPGSEGGSGVLKLNRGKLMLWLSKKFLSSG